MEEIMEAADGSGYDANNPYPETGMEQVYKWERPWRWQSDALGKTVLLSLTACVLIGVIARHARR